MTKQLIPELRQEYSCRKYGKIPISVVLLHGGPGGIGELAQVAERLSTFQGILEPLQTKLSLQEELLTLKDLLEKETAPPVVLIGHSFGAWVALLFAIQFPFLVRKLILIGCPPFEERYVPSIMETRLSRMSQKDVQKLEMLKKQLSDPSITDKDSLFARLGKLFQKCDSFDPIENDMDEKLRANYEVFKNVWPEGKSLRNSGVLLEIVQKVTCPITAIHGEWDPHPLHGAFDPLDHFTPHFKGIILKECGHTPWIERKAKDQFFDLLQQEIQS